LSTRRTIDKGNNIPIQGEVHAVTDRKIVSKVTDIYCEICGFTTEVEHSFPYEDYKMPTVCPLAKGGCGKRWSKGEYTDRPNTSSLFDLHIVTLKEGKEIFKLYLHGNTLPPVVGDLIIFECQPQPMISFQKVEVDGWKGATETFEVIVR